MLVMSTNIQRYSRALLLSTYFLLSTCPVRYYTI